MGFRDIHCRLMAPRVRPDSLISTNVVMYQCYRAAYARLINICRCILGCFDEEVTLIVHISTIDIPKGRIALSETTNTEEKLFHVLKVTASLSIKYTRHNQLVSTNYCRFLFMVTILSGQCRNFVFKWALLFLIFSFNEFISVACYTRLL